jgi:hypothetical protein
MAFERVAAAIAIHLTALALTSEDVTTDKTRDEKNQVFLALL